VNPRGVEWNRAVRGRQHYDVLFARLAGSMYELFNP
jgi:hypothetical protein